MWRYEKAHVTGENKRIPSDRCQEQIKPELAEPRHSCDRVIGCHFFLAVGVDSGEVTALKKGHHSLKGRL